MPLQQSHSGFSDIDIPANPTGFNAKFGLEDPYEANDNDSRVITGSTAFRRICGKGLLVLGLCLLGLHSAPVQAQEVTSDPSGFHSITLLGNSDTIVSFPYTRPPAASGVIQSVTDNEVVISGHEAWTEHQFVYDAGVQTNTYFLFIRDGTKEGHCFGITNNTDTMVKVDLTDEDLTGVSAGDRVYVIPYWTLGTLFPLGKGIHVSTTPLDRKSEVLLKSINFAGINPSTERTFFFWSGSWRQFGKPLTSLYDDTPLMSDLFIVVRHNVADSTVLKINGRVVMNKWAALLTSNASGKQDNIVGLPRPVAISLDDSGLITSGAFTPSTSPLARTDELMVYDNSVAGQNKSSAATYFYWGGAWRQFGMPLTIDAGPTLVFTPGAGVVIRKNTNSGTSAWINSPDY
jgi:uncharacterized protein (TIGR02597 family)